MAPDCVTTKRGARACFQSKICTVNGPSKQLQPLQRLSADGDLTRMSAQRMHSSSALPRVCSLFRSRNVNANPVVRPMILQLYYADLMFRNSNFQLPNTLGISFVDNSAPEGPVGVICESPMRFIDQDTKHSFNIASITTSTSNRKRVPHGVSFGTVTRETGLSFSSPHNPAYQPIGKSGFLLMVKYSSTALSMQPSAALRTRWTEAAC
ncbi:hypothetical protein HPB52_014338 [Rhipicephalus sanguineus]|uniref:Uncharacterized protein n=1 Tax=Rhipicephalus sanguineus TaxID=34632 RepID=A0A9D4PRP0_RHISA|nr:hypothetical protein HPB52_014338 [Rhipicephalus sanguineus]